MSVTAVTKSPVTAAVSCLFVDGTVDGGHFG